MAVLSTKEKTNPTHKFTILDEDGNAVQPTVLTLTYYNRADESIINSRDDQNVFNTNNVVVTNGVVTWSVQVADTAVVDTALEAEIHVALWQWTANSKEGKHESIHRIENLVKVA